jgi:G:T-mismatch repair DNA endonuclease (very short patch repair protein)
VARDRENVCALEVAGWAVIRLWETDVLRAPE